MQSIVKTIQLADKRTITIETGKLAKQADGAVVVRMGNTMLLATVVAQKEPKEGADFLPLYVDYQEKFAAAGKIPGSFLRREGRLGDHEVLISRLVDRAIRPLFPKGYTAETQVNIALISADEDVLPDALAALAASAALMVSPIPFAGPISEVRVARIGGQLCINPTPKDLEMADIDLIVGATAENILMVEGEMREVQEEEMVAAIQFAHEAIKAHCKVQESLAHALGVSSPISEAENPQEAPEDEWRARVFEALYDQVYAVNRQGINNKQQRKEALQAIAHAYLQHLPEGQEIDPLLFSNIFREIEKKAVRSLVLEEGIRLDGRKLDEIRPIWSEVDYLPAAHGSAIFTRGETQSLTTVTLGSKLDEQLIDRVMTSGYSKFMLHYNFPGFSTGEVKPNRGPARREIGHGNLAIRALKQVLPPAEENPYTLRIVSDILESNGSSSMATVCAGSLALMDAGVRIKAPVSGIAMGLVVDAATGKYAVLSDILGDEDHLGDMDFKVAGTQKGITACQMDIKVAGLSYKILEAALAQSRAGRLHILEEMNRSIAKPREDYKSHVPRIKTMRIAKDMIGAVIGPGGKIIQEIQRESGATVLIEEEDGVGVVKFFAPDQAAIIKAEQLVNAIVAEPIVGEVYTGKVKTVKEFGAFVEFMPGKDGLLHISEVKWERIADLGDILEAGEEIQVKLTDIDIKTGKYRLSRKALLPKPVGTGGD
ncbi:MAG: polyribonucleotide nucleotidyltransferase [Bacteroidota bacterium]